MSFKVTIIVPVFNSANYLQRCIESIKKINFQSYQVIFIDNCSSDGSYEILKRNRNKKFKILKNKKNYGQTYSLNKAIRLSNSPFIAIMDSDDICLKNRIKYSYDFLSNNSKFALVAGKSNTINENDQIINFRKFTLKLNFINCRIFLDNPISHTTIMFRKKIFKKLGGYSQKYKYTQDFDLLSRILKNNYKIKVLNKHFTLVRKHKKQQSFKNKEKQDKERYEIVIRNIQRKTKLSKNIISLMKFVIFKKNKYFQKLSFKKQADIIDNILKKLFSSNIERLYYCTLIFSQNNNFNGILKFKILLKYIKLNKFLIFDQEILLRILKSFLRIII